MPCPFESDMVLILCRSTGIRDAQEEKDTSSINGTTTMSLQRPLSRSQPAAFQVPPPAKIRSRSLHWLLSRSPSGQGLSSSCCAGPNTVCRQGPSIS
ncbi:hypothetical protein DPMN_072288 [Dreissena polymorpha]|uniref:Uncharacterized protein n=1 Tax=Dreissena polymorpha TaxID=45954 RepID=A0A9D3Z665_DREPO|nr:hypothetical protein DPMN_072288 [Dreissena polymorpha]